MTAKAAARPILPPAQTYSDVTDQLAGIPLHFPSRRRWLIALLLSSLLLGLLFVAATVLFSTGVGIWGLNIPVNWAFAIHNYVWWLGIGHAGTLISALLLLLGRDWRNSLNRFAETMTLFAVICAGIYPILHLGRPWFVYWMFPYPATMKVWPQFRSPLEWDIWAVLTYLTVSIVFWYVGLIPDLAAARDRAHRRRWQVFFGVLSLGWRGSAMHWLRWHQAYRLLAALAVPLVVSVHSEVSLLFAAGTIPGWHSTIFPPYFVLGAAFSGFAVVAMIAIALRTLFNLQNLVTDQHLDILGKVLLATGLMTAYGYVFEVFDALYSGERARDPDAARPLLRRILVELLGRGLFQFRRAAAVVAASRPAHALDVVCDLYQRRRGHVARTLHDPSDQSLSRFSGVVVGHLPPDILGLGNLRGHDRTFPCAVPAHYPPFAGDLDL